MSKYVCQICGFIYDEAKGMPDNGIEPGTKFEDLPENWKCPLCGAEKAMFEKQVDTKVEKKSNETILRQEDSKEELREMSPNELSAICSNLARGCEKQYRLEEAKLFSELADYYASKVALQEKTSFKTVYEQLEKESKDLFPDANSTANEISDRGAKRALTWSEKVTKMMQSLLVRYEKEGEKMLKGTKIWVCDICGFIYIGEEAPAICPVCKVPSMKILEVK